VLSLRQVELLLFFADRLPDPPHRTAPGNYRALLNHGLIETYTRTHCGEASQVYRITQRGRVLAQLAEVELG
jgi:hypothetical protein